ncbi:MAG: oligoendopeptidase F [Chlamydiota bacterium]
MPKPRSAVKPEDTWDVEILYPTFEAWKEDYQRLQGQEQAPHWPELSQYQGRLAESLEIFEQVLKGSLDLMRQIEKLFIYAHLKYDEDLAEDAYKVAYSQALSLLYQYQEEFSWVEPEILSLPQDVLDNYLASEKLKDYRFHLEKILHLRPHTLPKEQEYLLALSGNALEAPQKAFSAINNADFKFGQIKDSEGQYHDLSHASYNIFIRSSDRTLRENAFKTLHNKFGDYENTLSEILQGQISSHQFQARARNYSSCLEASLYPKNIDTSVYHSLIKAVRSKLPALHRYTRLRKKLLGVSGLHLYDMYVPVIPGVEMSMSYDQAAATVLESVAPLGSQYQEDMRKGFYDHRWVDRYENDNKRSGAYSSGCYDSHPYILMNYQGVLNDVFTLAHEAGHSMHSLLSRRHQPYHYADYPIFVAEVASTFNEELLSRYLLAKVSNDDEKKYLINQRIEDIRATLFRQTMFAEFELLIHQLVEQKIPLTPSLLKEKYRLLNQEYFGPDVIIDEEIDIEWARIPHFYYNFYVYQYATGISAALTLANKVIAGGEQERQDYLNFLKGGCSQYPLELLKAAGADMTTPTPVTSALERFESLLAQLEK